MSLSEFELLAICWPTMSWISCGRGLLLGLVVSHCSWILSRLIGLFIALAIHRLTNSWISGGSASPMLYVCLCSFSQYCLFYMA